MDERADERMDGWMDRLMNETFESVERKPQFWSKKENKIQIFSVGTPLAIQELLPFVLSHCAVFIAL